MNADDKRRWLHQLLDLLPPLLRPSTGDRRFLDACARAYTNGWQPAQVAVILTARDPAVLRNPVLIAIQDLERVGERPPPATPTLTAHRRNNGCIACPPHAHCPHPVTDADRIPASWTAGRMALVRRLVATPGLTEDQREQAMIDLIAEQKARNPEWSTSG